MHNEKAKEPFVRLVKRPSLPFWKSWLIRIASVLLSLALCAVLIYMITEVNPLRAYTAMFEGVFGTERRIWNSLRDTMILLCVGLALSPAFKMRFWNLGGEGQILMGGLITAAVMRYCGDSFPTWLLLLTMVITSLVAGGIFALVPAYFKARWNTNETLFTLMLNYVATQIVACFSILWEAIPGSANIGIINSATKAGWIPTDFLPGIFGNFNYSINVIIVLALTAFMYIYMKYSKHGYEIAVVGESENTAKYAGINVKNVILRTATLSGALCGLTGFLLVAGSSHSISTSTGDGRGFTAIIVAWLAKFNPAIMVLISFILVFLDKGTAEMASQFTLLNESFADVLTAIVLFFILGSEFFINYGLVFRWSKHKEVK